MGGMLTCLDTNVYISFMFPSERIHQRISDMMLTIGESRYTVWRNKIIEKEIRNVTRSLQSFLNATIIEIQIEYSQKKFQYIKISYLWVIEKKLAHEIGTAIRNNDLSKIKRLQHAEYLVIRYLERRFEETDTINIDKELENLLSEVHNVFFVELVKLLKRFKDEKIWIKSDRKIHQKIKSKLNFIENYNDIKILTGFLAELEEKKNVGIFVSLDQHFLKNRDQLKTLFPQLWIVRPLYYRLARISIAQTDSNNKLD